MQPDTPEVQPNSVFELTSPESFPKKPVNATEKLRKQLAERGKKDLYFLAKSILGYSKIRPEVHGSLCRFLDMVKCNRRMILMPRTHYKTTIATIADTIKEIINDPNIRILIVSDTGTNAEMFMLEIGNHFRHNELFRWLYPEVIPDNFNATRWNQKQIVVKRSKPWKEPTVDAMGAGGGIESRHYDIIKADDLVTEKHMHSETELEKLIAWAGGLEPLLVNDVEGRMDFVGSRKIVGDLYEWFEGYYGEKDEKVEIGPHAYQQGSLAVYYRQVEENGKLIFPYDPVQKSGVTYAYVNRMRKHDPARYHAQLANSPKGVGLNTFDVKDLRHFKLWDDGTIEAKHEGRIYEVVDVKQLTKIILYDPSVAEHKRSSKQAILVMAKGSSPRRFFLEAHIRHFPVSEAIELLFELQAKHAAAFVSIEKRGFQGSIKYWAREKAEREFLPDLPILEYPPEGSPRAQWAKTEHIRGLQPLVRAHYFWMPDLDQMDDGMKELYTEFEFYPNIKWDDGLDAAAQSLEWAPYTMDPDRRANNRQREEEFLAEAGFGDFPVFHSEDSWDAEQLILNQIDPTGYGLVN